MNKYIDNINEDKLQKRIKNNKNRKWGSGLEIIWELVERHEQIRDG